MPHPPSRQGRCLAPTSPNHRHLHSACQSREVANAPNCARWVQYDEHQRAEALTLTAVVEMALVGEAASDDGQRHRMQSEVHSVRKCA